MKAVDEEVYSFDRTNLTDEQRDRLVAQLDRDLRGTNTGGSKPSSFGQCKNEPRFTNKGLKNPNYCR